MNASILRDYRKFRGSTGLVGRDAEIALRNAKLLAEWRELESSGHVRIVARADELSSYEDLKCDCGDKHCPHNVSLQRDGAWGVVGQWRENSNVGSDHDDSDYGWEDADSVWGCVGYSDVLSPFENAHVVDVMWETIEAFRSACPNLDPAQFDHV